MSNTDIVASPHGAQLTNMLFMDRNSSIMEFFPKGWLELAGLGQYAHHWMADLSGMKHQGAWWDPNGEKECPFRKKDPEFHFAKKILNALPSIKMARLVIMKPSFQSGQDVSSTK